MSPQQTIAHYRITTKLGEGGMGEVWRATDTKLNREVAIKVLPESFAQDADRMARFEREAQVLASLNHPNIATVHGVEDRAIVLELVEGPTLAERIAQGPIPLDEALPIARQIAEALEYAHEKGIIHRDLKPANIKITPEGRVKVLDFGLAKAMASEASGAGQPEASPTLTMRATMAGVILGTAAYMSPEQARGQEADKRADIWSFGVLVYEMLTGRKLFEAPTVSDSLAAVLRADVDWSALPAGLPSNIGTMLRRCLERDPKRRLRDIGAARIELEQPATEQTAPVSAPASRRSLLVAWILAAVTTVVGVIGWAIAWRATRPTDRPLMWLNVDLGPDARAGRDFTAAISPDGTRLVYSIGDPRASRLAVRSLGQPNATPLAGTEGGGNPFFSPNGEWVVFGAGHKLQKISIHGGSPITLCDAASLRGGAWGEDGFIVAALSPQAGLSRVPENGGSPQPLAKLENGEVTHRWPQILPGRKAVLFSASSAMANWEEAHVEVLSLKTGQRKTVVRGGFFGRYLPSGHLVYRRGGTLYGMAFDIDRLEPAGPTATLLEGIPASDFGGGQFDFSRNGTLVYLAGNASIEAKRKLVWIDAGGKTQPFFAAPDRFFSPALSPDGKRLAASIGDPGASDLWVYDLEREIPTKLPSAGPVTEGPVWAPDGKHLVYGSAQLTTSGVKWIRADGGGEPQLLSRDDALLGPQLPATVSPDGRFVLFGTPGRGAQILTIDTTDPDHPKAGAPEPLMSSSVTRGGEAISPDSHWLAYTSVAPGTPQVFVRPFANGKIAGSGVSQISAAGGAYPVWSRAPGARQLLYVTPEGRVMVVDYTVEGDSFHGLKPRPWTDKQIGSILSISAFGLGRPPFDLTPDGRRIIAWAPQEQPREANANLHVTMLLNWFDELRRRLPPSGK
ncbi:MAG TPA: protein kinase [Bryobacteraceae bacterium]|nr:protein kinase [Bryobacteraceae bacterium]